MNKDRLERYSLAGPENQAAVSAGLASGDWFRSAVPRKRMKELIGRPTLETVAARTGVSRSLVSLVHVANILAKLGFRSRTQIVAWVVDQEHRAPRPGREPEVSDGPAR